ncbi:hypothetical protein SIN8267_01835 [Sinobacterium norvegicum]|uniref:DUF2860 domain-containing protein n=1 Tax=Sinobacterium norvegicum TaxID=1641715 RepID=A0ABM9AG40_9GAMM|nr:DUF2860 family protein [Sinobacterium norvegicum]CAH0991721.1 hypothetical protein SIN8267_01835 [Sinobacterium norvegicum]
MRLTLSVLLCSALLTTSAMARNTLPEESGFSGDILFGVMYTGGKSLMAAGDDDKQTLDSLEDSPDSSSKVLPALTGNLYYTFNSLVDQAYVGVSRSKAVQGQFSPELGYRRLFSKRSNLTIAYVPNLIDSDTWSDPFLTGQERDQTEAQLSVVRAKWQGIVDSPFGVEVAYGESDIEDEQSGASLNLSADEQAALQRGSRYYYIGGDITFPLARGTLMTTTLYHLDRKADGEAYSFDTFGIELGTVSSRGRHTVIANLTYESHEYDGFNPVFQQTRDDNKVALFLAYFYAEPFGWNNISYSILSSFNDRSSNIGFYEQQGLFVATGLNYDFK